MLSELRVEDIWKSLDGHVDYLPWGFALAIAREAYQAGQEDMQDRAAEVLGYKIDDCSHTTYAEAIRNLEIKEPK